MLSQVPSLPPADEEVTLTPCGVAGLLPMPQRRASGDAEEFADSVDTDQVAAIVVPTPGASGGSGLSTEVYELELGYVPHPCLLITYIPVSYSQIREHEPHS